MDNDFITTKLIKFTDSEAPAYTSYLGTNVQKGAKTSRLAVSDDPRFHIAVKVIKSGDLVGYLMGKIAQVFGYSVQLQLYGDTTVFVNIKSVTSRLLFTKEEVSEAAKNKVLLRMIEKRVKAISEHEKISKNLKLGYRDKIDLMKAIKVAFNTSGPQLHRVQLKSHTYHVGFDETRNVLDFLRLGKVFGKGCFAEVLKAKSVKEKTSEVLKRSKLTAGYSAKENLIKESEILFDMHKNGKVWGILAQPRRFVTYYDSKHRLRHGYLGIEYDRDYYKEIQKSDRQFDDYLSEFHQLLTGLHELSKRNILHGDLDPTNVLVKTDADGTKLVHLGDLGGACKADPTMPLLDIAGENRIKAKDYCCRNDLIEGLELAHLGDYQEIVQCEKQRDVFSMGIIFYNALTKESPFPLDKEGYPDVKNYRPIKNPKIPDEIRSLIHQMLNPNRKRRITAHGALIAYEEFLKDRYPRVLEAIHAKIARDYPGTERLSS